MFLHLVMRQAAAFCTLESSVKMVDNPVQQAVSIVKARRHIGMNHNLGGFPVRKISIASNTVEMAICHTTSVLYMVVHT